MRLGAFTINVCDQPFEQALLSVHSLGCGMVEIGCGFFNRQAALRPSGAAGR
jgi:hypothetical protein